MYDSIIAVIPSLDPIHRKASTCFAAINLQITFHATCHTHTRRLPSDPAQNPPHDKKGVFPFVFPDRTTHTAPYPETNTHTRARPSYEHTYHTAVKVRYVESQKVER